MYSTSKIIRTISFAGALVFVTLSPTARAVTPPPDGGDPNQNTDLIALNEEAVKLEQAGGADAHTFFEAHLSNQLLFRRASGKLVGKEEFLAGLDQAGHFSSRRPEDIRLTQLDDRALVTLVVVGTRADDGSVHRYRNIRLFSRSGEKWVMELWYNFEIMGP